MDKDCNEFQLIISDMKSSFPLWEDFTSKAFKLHSVLRCTILASTGFLDAFQKLADSSLGNRGATKDIGSSLTRLCIRHKAVEDRLKKFTMSIVDALVGPLQGRMEEWKKSIAQLEKDHIKEYRKCHVELKKASSETNRLQKKVNKGKIEYKSQLDDSIQEVNSKFSALETTEKTAVLSALREERSHLCQLISCLKPLVDQEISMLSEVEHLKEIIDKLTKMSVSPFLSFTNGQMAADATSCLLSQATLERKKQLLKDDVDLETISNSSGSSRASSVDASSAAGSLLTPDSSTQHTVQFPFPLEKIKIASSSSYQLQQPVMSSHRSPSIESNSSLTVCLSKPGDISPSASSTSSSSSSSTNPYAVPSVSRNNTMKVVDKIYARPALLTNHDNSATLKRVMTPTVPSLATASPFLMQTVTPNLAKVTEYNKGNVFTGGGGYVTQSDLYDLAKLQVKSNKVEEGLGEKEKSVKATSSNKSKLAADTSDEMDSLAAAIRELEASTAMLQVPFVSDSCQSLQCSSGYGTMTNVSSSNNTLAPDNLDALADALLESCDFPDFDKYCTLPNKRLAQSTTPSGNSVDCRRPSSAAGIKTIFSEKKFTSQNNNILDSDLTLNCDNLMTSLSNGPSEYRLPSSINQIDDDDDDLPLPPPPDDFDLGLRPLPPPKPFTVHLDLADDAKPPRGLSVHADVMKNLNEKLTMRNSVLQPTQDFPRFRDFPRPQDILRSQNILRSKNITRSTSVVENESLKCVTTTTKNETAEGRETTTQEESSNFDCQIRRGVRLRHTICNDRSAPRMARK